MQIKNKFEKLKLQKYDFCLWWNLPDSFGLVTLWKSNAFNKYFW